MLDDCSHDRTPAIIKNYAHDGVRFVPGNAPTDGWTGKNHAMQVLAKEASGEYVVFSDVDNRVEPHSLTQIIRHMMEQNLSMISILPSRRHFDILPNLFHSLYELWMISTPIQLVNKHPVSGVFTAYKASELRNFGHFESVKNQVSPEFSLSKKFATNSSYQLLISTNKLAVTTRKKLGSIADTQIRIGYPMLSRDPALVLFATAALLFFWNRDSALCNCVFQCTCGGNAR